MAQLTDPQRQTIEAAILAGNKIEAIKLYREATGVGLAEAKETVEALEAGLRQKHPDRFTPSRKTGCMGMAAVLGVVAGVMLLAVKRMGLI